LRVITLAHEPLDVALPTTHHLAELAELRLEDVAGERWVTSRGGYSPHDVMGAIATVANRNVDVVHRINDYGGVAAVVAAGDVIGMLPRYMRRHTCLTVSTSATAPTTPTPPPSSNGCLNRRLIARPRTS
jgi:DNA-binding transcriptional LysR family regulator